MSMTRKAGYEVDRVALLKTFDDYAERHPKAKPTQPQSQLIQTSADKLAVMGGDYFQNSEGDRVTAYSIPISLC